MLHVYSQQQQLTQLLAVLPGLGVPADKLRAEVVRLFDLPEAFNEAAPPAPAPEAPAAEPGSVVAPPEAAPTPSADTAAVIGGV